MASKELIIDDDYCKQMGTYFDNQGEHLNEVIAEYVTILQTIKDTAIKEGDVSKALGTYITYAKKMEKQIGILSETSKSQISNFLAQVDRADQYIF